MPLLIQQNTDGSNFFNRSWAEFKVGFSDRRGNYWLGNDLLHQITKNTRYKLRFDLQARSNLTWYYSEYSSFVVSSEASNYRIGVSGYSGNAPEVFTYHDGAIFSTYDRDNDQTDKHCALNVYQGGFWYKACARCGINGVRSPTKNTFYVHTPETGILYLETSRMWLTC